MLQLCSLCHILFWCEFTSALIYKTTMTICFRSNHPSSHPNSGVQQKVQETKIEVTA